LASPLGGKVASAYGVHSDAMGRLLVNGVISDSQEVFRLAIWRLDPNGRLDTGFGHGGVVYSDDRDWGWALDVDASGRILTGGFEGIGGRDSARGLVKRFLSDGSLDRSFGVNGVVSLLNPNGNHAAVLAVRALPRGKIMVAGTVGNSKGQSQAVVWRLLSNGQLDPTFAQQGMQLLALHHPGDNSEAYAMTVQRGSLYVSGSVNGSGLTVWKMNSAGVADLGFGDRGLMSAVTGVGRGLIVDPNLGLWVNGFSSNGNTVSAVLTHVQMNGYLDTNFARGGVFILPSRDQGQNQESAAMTRSPSGVVYLAGSAASIGKVNAVFWAVAPNGVMDFNFGERGIVLLANAAGGNEDRAYGVAHIRGAVVGVGVSQDANGKMLAAVWRLAR
jgi:uncharacterized delta-60 repeat protein